MSVDKSVSADEFRTSVRDAMLRYPHEPFFPLMGAVRAQATDDGSVVGWVARSLELNPHFGRAHFVLARSLAPRHAAQARLEYRLAFENDETLRDQIGREAVRLVVDADTALEIVPDGTAGIGMLEVLVVAVAPRLPSTAILLDQEIERRSPTATGPLRRRITAAAADAAAQAPWCTQNRCIEGALQDAELLAVDGLELAGDVVTDRAACQREAIALSMRTKQTRRGDLALEQLVRGGCGATAECIALYTWAANMEESRGHYALAVRLYKRVIDIAPERDDLLERIGGLGSQPGVRPEAVAAYGILATRHPEDPRWPARMAELRAVAAPPPILVP